MEHLRHVLRRNAELGKHAGAAQLRPRSEGSPGWLLHAVEQHLAHRCARDRASTRAPRGTSWPTGGLSGDLPATRRDWLSDTRSRSAPARVPPRREGLRARPRACAAAACGASGNESSYVVPPNDVLVGPQWAARSPQKQRRTNRRWGTSARLAVANRIWS